MTVAGFQRSDLLGGEVALQRAIGILAILDSEGLILRESPHDGLEMLSSDGNHLLPEKLLSTFMLGNGRP